MEVVNTRALVGDLPNLLHTYWSEGPKIDSPIINALKGDQSDGEFRVQAPDIEAELFFNNRELLARFTSLPKPRQENLLTCIRNAMHKEKVSEIHLAVQWSSASRRVIKIRQLSGTLYGQGPLNMFMD